MEDDSTRKLEVVLRLVEKTGAHIVPLQAERDAWVPTIIRPSTGFDDVRVAALTSDLRLLVSAPENSMQPGFPLFLPPGDFRTGAVGRDLHVLILKNGGRKGGGDIALDPEPLIGKVCHRSVDGDGTGIENRGPKA